MFLRRLVSSDPSAVVDITIGAASNKCTMKSLRAHGRVSSLGEGIIVVATKKESQLEGDPPTISPENIAFVEQNYEKLQQLSNKMSPQE